MRNFIHPFGLGDLAHWVFRPVAYFSDIVWGADMRHCAVCRQRRERWNAILAVPRWFAMILTLSVISVVWWMLK